MIKKPCFKRNASNIFYLFINLVSKAAHFAMTLEACILKAYPIQ